MLFSKMFATFSNAGCLLWRERRLIMTKFNRKIYTGFFLIFPVYLLISCAGIFMNPGCFCPGCISGNICGEHFSGAKYNYKISFVNPNSGECCRNGISHSGINDLSMIKNYYHCGLCEKNLPVLFKIYKHNNSQKFSINENSPVTDNFMVLKVSDMNGDFFKSRVNIIISPPLINLSSTILLIWFEITDGYNYIYQCFL